MTKGETQRGSCTPATAKVELDPESNEEIVGPRRSSMIQMMRGKSVPPED
jgi:hypothetical protein